MQEMMVLKETKKPSDNKIKKDEVDLVEKDTWDTKSTKDTFSTLPKKQLMIKGCPGELFGQFKMLSNMLGCSYSDFLGLCMAAFIEQNRTIHNRLTGQPLRFKPIPQELPKGPQRSRELDIKIKEFKELLNKLGSRDYILRVVEGPNGKKTPSKLWRREVISQIKALGVHLDDKKLPEEQRQEIAEFLEGFE